MSAGSYYLIVRTDMWNNVTELDETNNQQMVRLTIGLPDLTPTSFTVPATGKAWQTIPQPLTPSAI